MSMIYEFGQCLQERAHWTHNIIEKSAMYRLGIMEETITDMHLFSIADQFKNNVLTKKFNRREEGSKSGADWLWLVGEPGSWLPLLIQAKIINPQTGNCNYLDYKSGEQRTRLLTYARQHKFVPLYCIYSMIPSSFPLPQFSNRKMRSYKDWACSFVSPKTVRILSSSGKKTQYDILQHAIPWMEPFYIEPQQSTPAGESCALRLEEIRDEFDKSSLRRLPGKIHSDNKIATQTKVKWENLDSVHAVMNSIPRSICKLFTGKHLDYYNVPFSGASIISSVPIEEIRELKE